MDYKLDALEVVLFSSSSTKVIVHQKITMKKGNFQEGHR